MKYINHMTTSSEDDRHAEVMEQAGGNEKGLAAYGLYWVIAERIAAQIRPEQITTWMTRSWKKWGEMCGIRPTLFQKRVKSMAKVGLIFLYCDEKSACIHLPNLLKYADEYIKRILKISGQTPDSVGRMSSLPALPAYPEKQDLKTSACGIVDNSLLTDGANDGGDGLGATPPSAPRSWMKGNGVHPKVKALNLPPEKEASVSDLYQRHQAERIRGDDISDALRSAGLDQGEVLRVASLFIGA